jgi:hypothetical protein
VRSTFLTSIEYVRRKNWGTQELFSRSIPGVRNQAVIGFGVFALAVWTAWELGGEIASNNVRSLEFAGAGFFAAVTVVAILRNWRTGFYLFLAWMLFEDLFRKYMGNGLALFFGKDILAALVYISLFTEIRRKREKRFQPPFLLFLVIFFFLGFVQVFNQNSPHILYGLLGFKTYFYYIPFMYVGYAFVRGDEDLRKFLVLNTALSGLIAGLGIVQAIIGNSFLNPAKLAPELRDLGNLEKSTDTRQIFNLPDSVFVSAGRFDQFLILAFILALGTAGYLLLCNLRGRKVVFISLGIIGVATLLSGNRGSFMLVLISALAMGAAFLWGAPWRQRQAHKMIKAIRNSLIFGAAGLVLILFLFPKEAGSRVEYYTETLLPSGSSYQLENRTWDYPIENLLSVFSGQNWVLGNGIGTASLGTQYVAKLLGQPAPNLWVEEGYGVLIVEMGIIAPFLWILWTAALVYCGWGVVRRLRQTRFFPIALSIFWFAFLLLYPMTYGGLSAYQNYINNVYLWILVGILFRLPEIQASTPNLLQTPSARASARGGFQF